MQRACRNFAICTNYLQNVKTESLHRNPHKCSYEVPKNASLVFFLGLSHGDLSRTWCIIILIVKAIRRSMSCETSENVCDSSVKWMGNPGVEEVSVSLSMSTSVDSHWMLNLNDIIVRLFIVKTILLLEMSDKFRTSHFISTDRFVSSNRSNSRYPVSTPAV